MKFGKLLAHRMVPEWSDRYLRYKLMKGQLKRITAARENYLHAYAKLKEIAGDSFQEMPLKVENMKEDRELYDLLEEDLETVERFYLDQLVAAHKRFYQLLQHCIKMELLEEYTPLEYPLLMDKQVDNIDDINPNVFGDETEEDSRVVSERNMPRKSSKTFGSSTGGEPSIRLSSPKRNNISTSHQIDLRRSILSRSTLVASRSTPRRVVSFSTNLDSSHDSGRDEKDGDDDGMVEIELSDMSRSPSRKGSRSRREAPDVEEEDIYHEGAAEHEWSDEKLEDDAEFDNGAGVAPKKEKAQSSLDDKPEGPGFLHKPQLLTSLSNRKLSSSASAAERPSVRPFKIAETPIEKTRAHRQELRRRRKQRILYGIRVARRLTLKKMIWADPVTLSSDDNRRQSEDSIRDGGNEGEPDELTNPPVADPSEEPATPRTQQRQRWFLPRGKTLQNILNTSEDNDLPLHVKSNQILVFKDSSTMTFTKSTIRHHRKSLVEAFKEFYRGLCLLENFCKLNLSGFDKVMKKHDKLTGTKTRLLYIKRIKNQHRFADMRHLLIIKAEAERIFAQCFTENSRQKAMKKLRIPFWQKKRHDWSTFRLGLSAGLSAVLLTTIFFMFIYILAKDDRALDYKRAEDVFIMFRGMWLLIILNWCWGIDMYTWSRYRVSYALIFLFDMRSHLSWQQMMESAAIFTVGWLIFILCYLLSAISPVPLDWMNSIPYQLFPGCLGLLIVLVILVQQTTCKYWLLRRMYKIIVSPVVGVDNFVDIYLASQLTSLVIFLQDVQFSICFFVSDAWTDDDACLRSRPHVMPAIAAIPFVLRFLQCLRKFIGSRDRIHLINSGKYISSLAVILCSYFLYVFKTLGLLVPWILAVLLSVAYNFYFDVRYDWGLLDLRATENRFLRDRLIFPKWWYYMAIPLNLLGRCLWALTISASFFPTTNMVFSTIIATLEVIRRGMANIFRLEDEQLSYTQVRRAVRDVKLPLSIENDQLERLLYDEADDL